MAIVVEVGESIDMCLSHCLPITILGPHIIPYKSAANKHKQYRIQSISLDSNSMLRMLWSIILSNIIGQRQSQLQAFPGGETAWEQGCLDLAMKHTRLNEMVTGEV